MKRAPLPGSMPVMGSSSTSRAGWWTIAPATLVRWRSPGQPLEAAVGQRLEVDLGDGPLGGRPGVGQPLQARRAAGRRSGWSAW